MRRADGGDPRADPHVQLVEHPPRGRGQRDAHGRLARAGPLEGIAQIFVPELDGAGQVGVAGARQRHQLARIVDRLDRHARRPGFEVIGVLDQHRQGRPQRAPMPHAREDARLLRLDGHAPAAAVPQLAALQIALEVLGEQAQPGGKAVEDADQRRPMRLARGEETKASHWMAALRSSPASSSSRGRRSQISSDAMAWCTSTSMPSTRRAPRASSSNGDGPCGV